MNTCIYDGKKIISNLPSLGFILGDEGSGAYVGKILLKDYLRGRVPEELTDEVRQYIKLSYPEIVARLYTQPRPNAFCASFCSFVADRRATHTYFHGILERAFKAFFDEVVCLYPEYRKYKLNCVGSLAYGCRDLMEQIAAEYSMETGNILKSPIDGLSVYHSSVK